MSNNDPLAGLIFLIAGAVYLLPMFVAIGRGHKNAAPITLVNFFFGWTFIGWVVALAWSCSHQEVGHVT